MHAGISPAVGHSGFHKIVKANNKELLADHYFHYLHHRYFTVNFGVQEVPLDWWFQTHHDGSPESQARMTAARERK
jgi:sterol desaturase/sphingolipid hydroxylase (fatty acid hydroxylase superfamily)